VVGWKSPSVVHLSHLQGAGKWSTLIKGVMADKEKGNDDRSIGKYLELALLLPISTMVGLAMGYGLDRLFGTHFLYLIFMVLGTAAGIIQLIRGLS
jgi:F0F1-type ATP synthase assembly protein I